MSAFLKLPHTPWKRLWLPCLFLAFGHGLANAQYFPQEKDTVPTQGFDKHKLFLGGNLGLSFGDMTYLNLSPAVGYRFSSLLAMGLQINGQYESVRYRDQTGSIYQKDKYGMLGLGLFGRLYPVPQLFIHVQPEMNFIFGKSRFYDGSPDRKFNDHVPSFLAGLGYAQSVGGNSAVTLMVLYDVLQRMNSPYGDKPVFRVGADLGF